MPKDWVRKELKTEPLSNFVEKSVRWVIAHREVTLSLLGTVAIICGVIIYFISHLKKVDARAWQRLSLAQAYHQRRLENEALNLYNEVLDRYQRSSAFSHALFYKAELFYQQKKYHEAAEIYQNFIQQNKGKKYLFPLVYAGLGASIEGENNYFQAISVYQEFINKFPEHFLTPAIYLSLANCYQGNGQKNEATNIYEKIITSYPGSNWQKMAENHLKNLK